MLKFKTGKSSSWSALFLSAALAGAAACGDDDADDGGDQPSAGRGGSAGGSEAGKGGSGGGSSVTGGSGGKAAGGTGGTGAGGNGGSGGRSDAGAGGASGSGGAAGSDKDPVYLSVLRIFVSDDSVLQYARVGGDVKLSASIDDLTKAREFGGYSGFTTQGGNVLVGDQEAPFVTKYEITDDLEWKQVGERLSFSDYFQEGNGLNDYFQIKAGDDQFFFYGAERTARVHFSVKDWKILGSYQDTSLPTRTGWTLGNAGNRTDVKNFVDAIVWPFVLAPDEEGSIEAPESYLAVYDKTTHLEKAVLHPSCPDLTQSTIDEDGNLYFSSTYRSPLLALYKQSPPNCVVKVKPDGTLDESFGKDGVNDLTAWTDGKVGTNFWYLRDGKAAAAILDTSRLNGANFDGPVQPEVVCQADYCDEMSDLYNPKVWDFNVIDLKTGTSKPITGGDPKHAWGGSYRVFFNLDGHTYFAIGNGNTESPGLVMYELNVDDATVTQIAEAPTPVEGEFTRILRVR